MMRTLITAALAVLSCALAVAGTTTTDVWTLLDAAGARVADYPDRAACVAAPQAPGSYACLDQTRVVVVDDGWVFCSDEGGVCSFSGTREVRFGTASMTTIKATTRTFTGSVVCSTAMFGDPAYGERKSCAYSSKTVVVEPSKPTTTPTKPTGSTKPTAPTYTRTQMFALGYPSIAAEAGQDVTLRVRFYGVALPDNSKIFVHLYPGTAETKVADLQHHYALVATRTWSGYVEVDYVLNVPLRTPPGTYRVAAGLFQAVSPFAGRQDRVECNGRARLLAGQSETVRPCHVGTITVRAATRSRSTATDGPMAMFYATTRAWSPSP